MGCFSCLVHEWADHFSHFLPRIHACWKWTKNERNYIGNTQYILQWIDFQFNFRSRIGNTLKLNLQKLLKFEEKYKMTHTRKYPENAFPWCFRLCLKNTLLDSKLILFLHIWVFGKVTLEKEVIIRLPATVSYNNTTISFKVRKIFNTMTRYGKNWKILWTIFFVV